MQSLNIEILNPKARKLLEDLADLRLISIEKSKVNSFLEIAKKIRKKGATISLDEITKEVESVRKSRNEK